MTAVRRPTLDALEEYIACGLRRLDTIRPQDPVPDYDFHTLSPIYFEQLTRKLLQAVYISSFAVTARILAHTALPGNLSPVCVGRVS